MINSGWTGLQIALTAFLNDNGAQCLSWCLDLNYLDLKAKDLSSSLEISARCHVRLLPRHRFFQFYLEDSAQLARPFSIKILSSSNC